MQTPTQEEISRIVDEVVRRVTGQPAQGVGAPASPVVRASDVPSAPYCGCSSPSAGEPVPVKSGATAPASAGTCTGDAACTCAGCRADNTRQSREILNRGANRVGCTDTTSLNCNDLAAYIDHTLLKANATEAEIEKLCAEARKYKFASVCVNTSYVETCSRLLAGSGVKVCCVVGFPLGAMTSESKAFETRDAIARGAEEIDMVINVGKLLSGAFDYIYDDIRAVVRAALGNPVKVILETGMLNDDQKIAACTLAKAAGAQFVKTSTGFGPGGATAEDISLMRRIVGEQMGVKASGGIRDCATAQQMVANGATRLGASASVGIVQGQAGKGGY